MTRGESLLQRARKKLESSQSKGSSLDKDGDEVMSDRKEKKKNSSSSSSDSSDESRTLTQES